MIVSFLLAAIANAAEPTGGNEMYPEIRSYLDARIKEFDQIPVERRTELKKIARYVKGRAKADQPAQLTFICTHNSRRSHMSQIWAATAAEYYGAGNVKTYSGGTEATTFNPRAVASMQVAGLKVSKI